jgi:hypothetical protein
MEDLWKQNAGQNACIQVGGNTEGWGNCLMRSFYDFYSSSNTGKFPFNVLICNVLPEKLL